MDHPMLDVDDGGLPQFPAEGLDQAMDMMQPDFATANQPEQGGSASDVNGCVPLPALHADRARPAALRRPPPHDQDTRHFARLTDAVFRGL